MKQSTETVKRDPRAGGGRVSRRRARTRGLILDAAETAFAQDGFRSTRMDRIAEAADVAVGSIYNHFANKDELYLALAERTVAQAADYMAAAFTASDSPLEQVMAAGDAYLRFHLEHPALTRYLSFDRLKGGPEPIDAAVRQRIGKHMAAFVDAFEDRIQAAIDAGQARSLDPRLVARFLFGAWNGVAALGMRDDELALNEAEIEACLEQARRIVLEGLTAPDYRAANGDSPARLIKIRIS